MKPFHAAAVILAVAAFGVGQSSAQTNATVPGSIGATSPLGAGFSDPAGSSQSAAVPYSGGPNLAPCSAGSPGQFSVPCTSRTTERRRTMSVRTWWLSLAASGSRNPGGISCGLGLQAERCHMLVAVMAAGAVGGYFGGRMAAAGQMWCSSPAAPIAMPFAGKASRSRARSSISISKIST